MSDACFLGANGARIYYEVALAFAVACPDHVESLIVHGATAPAGFGLKWSGPDHWPLVEYRSLAEERGLDASGTRGPSTRCSRFRPETPTRAVISMGCWRSIAAD